MIKAKRVLRKIKNKIEPLFHLDVQNQHHQALIGALVLAGICLFVLLRAAVDRMFHDPSVLTIDSSYYVDTALDDYSMCWFPEGFRNPNRSISSLSANQYRQIQESWKSELKFVDCHSYGSVPSDSSSRSPSIRHSHRLVYQFDVVKHLTSQWKTNDFASYESRGCSVHASNTMTNAYYNYHVEPVVNVSANHNSSHHGHPHPTAAPTSNSLAASTASSFYAFFGGQVDPKVDIPITSLNHNRLSDAGMCIMTSYASTSNTASAKDLIKCLPSFIIAGVMKSGTGELMKWLNTHPNLISGRGKKNQNEVHYFSPDQLPQYPGRTAAAASGSSGSGHNGSSHHVAAAGGHSRQRGRRRRLRDRSAPRQQASFIDYVAHFPAFHANQANLLYTFDKSPDYIRSPEVVYNIVNMMPSIKMIVLLRNPVQRAISAFNHNCRHGRYVRLLRDVTVDGVVYRAGRILNTDSKFSHGVSTGTGGSHRTAGVQYHIDASRLKEKKDFAQLKQPCGARDMHAYFFGGVAEHTTGSDVNKTAVAGSADTSVDLDHQYAPEVSHGFYDDQLSYVYRMVPKQQLLILFQESMYGNTFRTLREVEGFLGIPCYDYSQVTLLSPPGDEQSVSREDDSAAVPPLMRSNNSSSSTSGGGGADHRKIRPPVRAPVTLEETVAHYAGVVQQFFQLKKKPSDSAKLQREALPETMAALRGIYARHNQQLMVLLQRYQLHEEAKRLVESQWDL